MGSHDVDDEVVQPPRAGHPHGPIGTGREFSSHVHEHGHRVTLPDQIPDIAPGHMDPKVAGGVARGRRQVGGVRQDVARAVVEPEQQLLVDPVETLAGK